MKGTPLFTPQAIAYKSSCQIPLLTPNDRDLPGAAGSPLQIPNDHTLTRGSAYIQLKPDRFVCFHDLAVIALRLSERADLIQMCP